MGRTDREAVQRVMDIIPWETIDLPFSKAEARRVAHYMERYNDSIRTDVPDPSKAVTEEDFLDPASAADVITAVQVIFERGLEHLEQEDGFIGLIDGTVMPDTVENRVARERAREAIQRRRLKGED